ncbi:hypothetical protein PHYPSEUDO_009376 [Phytophthora pseudosyringae]|uniref:Uncharacterized protein n=1 Tax=Phytophthora pseudosyringae TaxID=221518 RepID=A0A8T1WCT5_9STRA|nr:hypothetical protein PHYPSEUDO_009376 [Phytophthora pseudosyringae]
MASPARDAELAVPAASDTSTPPSDSIAATSASPFALQAEIEASMEALPSPVCATDRSEETTEHEEAGTLLPSGGGEDAQDDEAVARDLDMLADTVRSIVTEVVGVEASVAKGGGEGGAKAVSTATSHEAGGNFAVETETASADDLSSNPGSDGDKSAQAVDITDVLLPEMAQKAPQDAANEATVAVPTSNNPEVGTATEGNPSAKRPAVSEGKSNFPSKKQKRADVSRSMPRAKGIAESAKR